jgi:hypothetical protein
MNSFKRWLSIKKHKNARLILLIGIIVFNLLLFNIARTPVTLVMG